MEVLLLAWKYHDTYHKDIILPGPFHTKMNHIGMLTNHKAKGSWYPEIFLKAVLVEKVYVKSVFSINAFTKALFDLKDACWTLVEETNSQICP